MRKFWLKQQDSFTYNDKNKHYNLELESSTKKGSVNLLEGRLKAQKNFIILKLKINYWQ